MLSTGGVLLQYDLLMGAVITCGGLMRAAGAQSVQNAHTTTDSSVSYLLASGAAPGPILTLQPARPGHLNIAQRP